MTDVLAAEAAEIAELEKQVTTEPAKAEVKTEPATQTEAAPESKEEDDGTDTIEVENRGRYIRKSDYNAVKERLKEADEGRRSWEARYAADMAKVSERLAAIAAARQEHSAQREPELQIPDINTDPIGHFQAQLAARDKQIAELSEWRKGQAKQSEADTQRQTVANEVTRQEQEFTTRQADYPDASKFLQEKWSAQGQLLGATPQQAIAFYAAQIAQAAHRQGKNFGEVAYDFAKSLGYQKPNGNGTQKTGPDLDTIAKGIAASKSTTTAPGKAPPGQLTAEALLKMDDDEFLSKFGGRDSSKDWAKVMRPLMTR